MINNTVKIAVVPNISEMKIDTYLLPSTTYDAPLQRVSETSPPSGMFKKISYYQKKIKQIS